MRSALNLEFLGSYLGLAGLYAVTGTAVLLVALRAFWGALAWQAWPLVASTLFFVSLTQHPLPDRFQLTCPVPNTQPLLEPFRFLGVMSDRLSTGVPVWSWFSDISVAALIMNFVICALIGAALTRYATRLRIAAIYGVCLSLGVELTQLTGIWGFYPCAYRQFDVDDLVINVGGVVIGFLAGRTLTQRSRSKIVSSGVF